MKNKKIVASLLLTSCLLTSCTNKSSSNFAYSVGNTKYTYIAPVEENMAVIDDDNWSLILVNKNLKLDEDFNPELAEIPKKYLINPSANKFDKRAEPHLIEMIEAAKKDGITLAITSAYRSVSYQQGLFDRKIEEYKSLGDNEETARINAAKYVAIPGTSEHSTGLAVDIVSKNWYSENDDLYETFEDTEEFAWLNENSHKYGFILRFPKDKVDITNINYEPWHYRYVGEEHAEVIHENNLTLEEYISYLEHIDYLSWE